MKSLSSFGALAAGLFFTVASAMTARAAVDDILFTVRLGGDHNTPTIYVTNNSPSVEITRFEIDLNGTTKHFDGDQSALHNPPGGGVTKIQPTGGQRNKVAIVDISNFGPGETFAFEVDIDQDADQNTGEDYAQVFYNNGSARNALVRAWSGPISAELILRDDPADPANPVFRGPERTLEVISRAEGNGEYVDKIEFLRDNNPVTPQYVNNIYKLTVAHGDRIQIKTLQEQYKNIHSVWIPNTNLDAAQEKFVAAGMSVNDVPQTADPTNYNFEITGNTKIEVKWQHYYALTVSHDFTKTQSQEVNAGTPWAGPLASDAAGNPSPPVNKHWVLRGTQPVLQVDGQYVDTFSHPGLDLRHVVKGYRAYGPPNSLVTPQINAARTTGVDITKAKEGTIQSYSGTTGSPAVIHSVGHGLKVGDKVEISSSGAAEYNAIHTVTAKLADQFTISTNYAGNPPATGRWKDATYLRMIDFPTVEPRQQVRPNFNMYGPGGVTYVWQIQYGVRSTTDDPARNGLAKVYEVLDSGVKVDRTVADGVSWFDPGAHVEVIVDPKEAGQDGLSATSWANGDGYYFSAQGEIDPSTKLPTSGGPAVVNGSPVGIWTTTGAGGRMGYEIGNLQRPVRTMWRFGAGAIVVEVVIGKSLFEEYPNYAEMFVRKPEPIINAVPDPIAIPTGGTAPGSEMMAEWDPVSARLYPTIPGTFTVPWKPGMTGNNAVQVRVVAKLPLDSERQIRGHYPHIHGTPAVALDPDPNDELIFKSIKYSTSGATTDANKLFTTERPGITTLLFSQIQSSGRGQPREVLKVRVVDTRAWDASPTLPRTVTVGQKIVEPDADLAKLGTGYLMDLTGRARYNPFVYDSAKLVGLAAKDLYDMELLRADNSSLKVVNKARLPGPVITVNEQPGAQDRELPIIVWYDDPRRNDTILWPYTSRIYKPAWPSASAVPQIVIASQYGSEGKGPTGLDQKTAPAIGNAPEATTYNPSRLQNVIIYQQPNRNTPGFNPNEEHALVAPSLRFADVSPRPPAIYALRDGDLNNTNRANPQAYTSHSFVLAQFFDVAADEVKMQAYTIKRQSGNSDTPAYRFAQHGDNPLATALKSQPYVTMRAGEPVIPFYPLGVAIGASPAPETFGNNYLSQETYWEDWRGSYWSISGGNNAWFNVSFYYPLAPDFWWPEGLATPAVKVVKSGARYTATYDADGDDKVPGVGDSVAFLPTGVSATPSELTLGSHLPVKVVYKSEWPENPPVLKAGETLTFSGGEYRTDHPTRTIVKNGQPQTVETPGLPQLTAFASAEVVFDSLNPDAVREDLKTKWTARVVQALDKRTSSLPSGVFPTELQPATGKTTVKQGKYVFNDLPASLQRRLRYDPLVANSGTQGPGALEMIGLLNDKEIGDATLTASPPAVYVLEPNILTAAERDEIIALVDAGSSSRSTWEAAVLALYNKSRNPEDVIGDAGEYLTGLMKTPEYESDGEVKKDEDGNVVYISPLPMRAYGPGLALVPNGNFLDPTLRLADGSPFPDEGWVTVVENNDPAMGGSPITPHIIKVDRTQRYRGSVKTVLSENVFDENIVMRSTGDFGANADDLVFEWWYRPDDGSLNVPPPDLIPAGQTNPWKLFPDPSGNAGKSRYQITLKGNPNAPEALLGDTWWFARYRHRLDTTTGTNWKNAKFTWAGAGNSDPFRDQDLDGVPDYRAQLAQGWIKRVLDAVNPYEARIRDFDGDSPSTVASMISQFGGRYEGPVALNPAKNVIENVGLIELYETILNRGRSLSIDLSQPVSTPAISNALQLASTRVSDFYTLLGNEAYVDALDPTIGHGSDSVDSGSVSTSVFSFQNQMSSLIEEELALLRGVDDYFARPVYNRLFWNFTKGEGEAAYATNYNLSDANNDGFIDEDDGMIAFPQGHGDAWGHYLTAVRNQYELLRHPYFNWVSRSESYNLQDIVITVDFLDERKFAAGAAAKAKTGAEIVALTYRDRYVADPNAQWQGYTDSNPDRAWGVDEWSRRAGQGAYFDWVTANALLPSEHPNKNLEGVRKVDRKSNADIAVVSANLSAIQRTIDDADRGHNPLGLARGAQVFDLEPAFIENASGGDRRSHFDQINIRAEDMRANTAAIWDIANQSTQMLRQVGNSEAEFRNSTFQEDLAYRNQLIQIFGKPYAGTVGPGKIYPAGYEGPDLALYMYVPVREINEKTVPGPAAGFAAFTDGQLTGGSLYDAFYAEKPPGTDDQIINKETALNDVDASVREIFNSTFANASNTLIYGNDAKTGMFAVNYTDLDKPKVDLENFVSLMPVTAKGYTFQAPTTWGSRGATGELQDVINQMIQQEAEVARAIGAWDSLSGESVRILRLINARLTTSGRNQGRNERFSRVKLGINDTIKALETGKQILDAADELVIDMTSSVSSVIPSNLPTAGLAFSPGDALSAAKGGINFTKTGVRAALKSTDSILAIGKLVAEISLDIAENELSLANADEARKLEMMEWIKELEDKVGDEPVLRIAIFKEIQALSALSDRYRTLLDEGARLVDERAAFNKRVAAQTQRNRYQDMTFRVSRNHALQTYRSSFDLAARYAYLAATAYDYETNFSVNDPGSAVDSFNKIIGARNLDELGKIMDQLKANHSVIRAQLGLNSEQRETSDVSIRGELMRILPTDDGEREEGEPSPSAEADAAWSAALQNARVPDLWQLPEFREQCRPFAASTDAAGKPVPQPGIVLRFSSDIRSGKNFFGKPLSGGDHSFSSSNFATKVFSVGVTFDGYRTDDIFEDLAAAPRVYFIPAGMDIMRVSRTDDPNEFRSWKVVEQVIPTPYPASSAQIKQSGYIPLLDALNGRYGAQRKFSDFRAYPDSSEEPTRDLRLLGRSIWNTEWMLIIPGSTLNANPEVGLDRFVDQVSDIKLILDTYGQSGG